MKNWLRYPKSLTLAIVLILFGLSWLEPNPSTAIVNVCIIGQGPQVVTFPLVVGEKVWTYENRLYYTVVKEGDLTFEGSNNNVVKLLPADEKSLKRVIKFKEHGDQRLIQRVLSPLAPINW